VEKVINPSGASLRDLADAINTAQVDVQATIVNVGGSSSPDYRLALQGTKLAADTISLRDDAGEMLDTISTGSNATYRVNGLATEATSDTRTITLAPELTVNLRGVSEPGVPATITVSRNVGAMQSALSGFAAGFNVAVDALQGQHGQSAGALSGQAVIYSLESLLRSVTTYTSGLEAAPELSTVGLVLGKDGHLSFEAASFSKVNPADVSSFFGSLSDGGFLGSAKSLLTQATDTDGGFLALTAKALNDQISSQSAAIETAQARLAARQEELQKRLAASDAAIAAMEQQVTFMTNLFKATSGNNNNQ